MQSFSVLAVLAIAFGCALAFDAQLDEQWQLWKATHNKQYSNVQELVRYEISFLPSKHHLELKYLFLVVLCGKAT